MPSPQKFPFNFPVLKTRCPHCHEEAVFGIAIRYSGEFGLASGKIHFLRCEECCHEKHLENGSADVWPRLRKAYMGLETGNLTQEQFDTIIQAADDPTINELLEEAEIWTCECGEENPMNFGECWSCGTEASGPVKDSPDINIDPGNPDPTGLSSL